MRRFMLVVPALTGLMLTVPAADAAKARHTVKLKTAIFANTVGSLTNGGSVIAGATADPTLGHGAVVLSVVGSTSLTGTFQVFYALGTIRGSGTAHVTSGANGAPASFTAAFKITGGTAKYRGAKGSFTGSGTVTSTGMIMATTRGSLSY